MVAGLRIILGCCLLALLAGCTGKPDHAVSFCVGGAPAELDFWEELVSEFTQQTGVQAVLLRQPADSDLRRQGLVIPLQAKMSDPDVFLMDVAWIAQFAASGWLVPLSDLAAPEGYDFDGFFPNVLQLADTRAGKIIALPIYVDAGLLYTRRDLLKQWNLRDPPETWEQLVQEATTVQRALQRADPQFTGFVWQGAQYEGLVCTFLEFAGSAGGGIALRDGRIEVDTPENRKAARFMHDLITRYRISPLSTYTEMREEEVRAAFQQGGALFERNWPYAWALHQSPGSPVAGKTGIAPLPHFPSEKSVSTLGGWHIGISRYSRRKALAWEFVRFLVSRPVQKQLALKLGWNPGRKDLYADPEVLAAMPHLARLKAVFEAAVPRPMVPYYAQLSEVLQRHLNAILAGKSSADAALAAAQQEADRLIARYGQE